MAVTLNITINNQELIDAFIALNERLNAQEGRSLTAQQRAKEILIQLVRNELLERNLGEFRTTELARVGGLD